jgi:hypothetical protein
VSIPSFLLGFLAFFLPEPSRGSQEKAMLAGLIYNNNRIMTSSSPWCKSPDVGLQQQQQQQQQQQSPLEIHTSASLQQQHHQQQHLEKEEDYGCEMQQSVTEQTASSNNTSITQPTETQNYDIIKNGGTRQIAAINGSDLSTRLRPSMGKHDIDVHQEHGEEDISYKKEEGLYVAEVPSSRTTCNMLRVPSVILLLIQGAPNVIPFGITSVFLNDFLSQDKGLSTEVSLHLH